MHWGVRGKLVAILVISLLLALSVNSIVILNDQKQVILDETQRRGHEATNLISHYLAYSVVSYDYHTIEMLLQDLIRSPDIVYTRVENHRGKVMAMAGTQPVSTDNILQYSGEIRLNGELLGQLHLALSTERIIESLSTRQRNTLIGQLLAIVALLLVGFGAVSMLIVRPLGVVTAVIKRNLESSAPGFDRVPLNTRDEFGDLARGFNALQDRLQFTQKKLEQRIDHANRELQQAYERLAGQAQDLRNLNRELEKLSITDPLTGLYNRRYFERLMDNEVAQSVRNDETISILLIDLDHFKDFNTRYGHSAGDDVVRTVAECIAQRVRLTDVACRYGGDEFFVLCRRATIANALAVADDMYRAITEQPINIHGDEIRLSVSIGVATIPGLRSITSAVDFFQCADKALRHCKENGRNGVVHFSMLERQARTLTQ